MAYTAYNKKYFLVYNSDGSGIKLQKIIKDDQGNESYVDVIIDQEIIDLIYKVAYDIAKMDMIDELEET